MAEALEVGIGLGSNIGDRVGHIKAALAGLNERGLVNIKKVSSLYRTAPWGPVVQEDYANACAIGSSRLAPYDLLDRLKQLEKDLGRQDRVRWGPRVIDIDLLFLGEDFLDDERLTLPHKQLFQRAFVLQPLAEIAPELVIAGRSIAQVAAQIGTDGVIKWPETIALSTT